MGPWAIAHRPMGDRPSPRGRSPIAPWAMGISEVETGMPDIEMGCLGFRWEIAGKKSEAALKN